MIRRYTKQNGKTSYRVRVDDGPQRSFARLKDAEEYEREQKHSRSRARAGLGFDAGPITYEALCQLYLASYDAPSKPWTEQMLRHSRHKFGREYVRALRSEQIGAWLNDLEFAPKTRGHILERMRAVLNAGVEWGYLAKSPARGRAVRSPGHSRAEEVQPFTTWAEVEKLADVAATYRSDFGAAIRFACATGLRPGEWLAITHANIDVKNRIISVPGTKNRNAQRSIPLSRMAFDAIAPTRGIGPIAVFPRFNYHRFRAHWWPLALKAAELEPRPPGQMRHTFATLALQAGVTIDVVSKWLGHSSVDITLRYYARYTRPVIDRNLALLDTLGEITTEQEEAK